MSTETEKTIRVDAMVTESGDVVIPSTALLRLELQPNQPVHVTVSGPRRENMRGILAGQLPDVSMEEFDEASRFAWGGSADE